MSRQTSRRQLCRLSSFSRLFGRGGNVTPLIWFQEVCNMYTLNTEKDAIQKYETATRWPALVHSDGRERASGGRRISRAHEPEGETVPYVRVIKRRRRPSFFPGSKNSKLRETPSDCGKWSTAALKFEPPNQFIPSFSFLIPQKAVALYSQWLVFIPPRTRHRSTIRYAQKTWRTSE